MSICPAPAETKMSKPPKQKRSTHGNRGLPPTRSIYSIPQVHAKHKFAAGRTHEMRRILEAEVIEQFGRLSIAHDSAISLAVTEELRRLIIAKSMRANEKLGSKTQAELLKQICQATAARDAAIRSLGLRDGGSSNDPSDIWAEIHAPSPPQAAPALPPEAAETASDTPEHAECRKTLPIAIGGVSPNQDGGGMGAENTPSLAGSAAPENASNPPAQPQAS